MKISEILCEMPVKTNKATLSTVMRSHQISPEQVEQYFIIPLNDQIDLLLDDEDSPTIILIGELQHDNSEKIIGRMGCIVYAPKIIVERTIIMAPAYQGKGIVTKVYLTLIEAGYSIISDSTHTDSAVSLWTKLIKNRKKYKINACRIDIKTGVKTKIPNTGDIWDDELNSRLMIS